MKMQKPKNEIPRVYVNVRDGITGKSRTMTLYETTVDGFFREVSKLIREKKQPAVAKSA